MILKNYYRLLSAYLMSNEGSVNINVLTENNKFHLVGVNGSHTFVPSAQMNSTYGFTAALFKGDDDSKIRLNGNTDQASLVIGAGTTPPTLDDYCLESEITTLTKVSFSHAVVDVNDNLGFTLQLVKRYVNPTAQAITIGEVGYWQAGNSKAITGSGNFLGALLIREVLDEPLVVPAGQGVTVTLNITFNGFEVLSSASGTVEGVFEFTELSEYKVESGGQSDYTEYLTLVSDTILTEEQLKNASILYIDEDGVESTLTFESEDCEFVNMDNQLLGIFGSGGDRPLVVSIPNDNTNIADILLFSKAGTYIAVYVDTENNNKFMFGVKKMTLATNAD